jgi:hypothetical protein
MKTLICVVFHRWKRTFVGNAGRSSFWRVSCAACAETWTEVDNL